MKFRVANAVVVKFGKDSDKRLVNMILTAQERGTFIKYPKKRVMVTVEKEK